MSLAFVAPPKKGGIRVWGVGKWIFGLLLFAGLSFVGWEYVHNIPDSRSSTKRNPLYPDLPLTSPLQPHLDRLDTLLRNPPPQDSLESILKWFTELTETVEAGAR